MGFFLSPARGTAQPGVIAPALKSHGEQLFLMVTICYAFPAVKVSAVPQTTTPTNVKKAPAPAPTPAPPPVDSSDDSSEESDSEEEIVPPSQVRSRWLWTLVALHAQEVSGLVRW